MIFYVASVKCFQFPFTLIIIILIWVFFPPRSSEHLTNSNSLHCDQLQEKFWVCLLVKGLVLVVGFVLITPFVFYAFRAVSDLTVAALY